MEKMEKIIEDLKIEDVKFVVFNRLLKFFEELKENYGVNIVYHREIGVKEEMVNLIKEGYFILNKNGYLDKYVKEEFMKKFNEKYGTINGTVSGFSAEEIYEYIKTSPMFSLMFITNKDLDIVINSNYINGYVIYNVSMDMLDKIDVENYDEVDMVLLDLKFKN